MSKTREYFQFGFPILLLILCASLLPVAVYNNFEDWLRSLFIFVGMTCGIAGLVILALKPQRLSDYINKDTCTKIKKWFNTYLPPIFIILSLLAIFLPSYHLINIEDPYKSLIEKTGFVALTSGVFAGILKSIQFTGIFKSVIEEIMLSTNFLKKRNDLQELWRAISKEIFGLKFPEIAETIESRILQTYLPCDRNHYMKNVYVSILIKELTEDYVVSYEQTLIYTAVLAKDKTESVIKYTNEVPLDQLDGESPMDLTTFKVNGKDILEEIATDEKILDEEKIKKIVYRKDLKNGREFAIEQVTNNKYSLKEDGFKVLRFNTITKNAEVFVNFPEDVHVSFVNIGVANDFEKSIKDTKTSISRSHQEDIILPRQGFGLMIRKK